MAECDWAILCDHAFQDINQKICMIGIFDRIPSPAVPAALAKASLVAKIYGTPGETCSFRVEVARQTGGNLMTMDGEFTFVGDSGSFDLLGNFINLPLPEFGAYSINIYLNGALSKAATFVVFQMPSQQPPPAPQS